MPDFLVHYQLLEPVQTHVHCVGDAIQQSHPLSSPSPPAFNLSQYQDLSKESVLCLRCPKYWSFSFNISPSIEYSGLISFRMDWLDLLAVQGTLKSLSNTTVQSIIFSALNLLYVPTLTSIHDYWKTIILTSQNLVSKVMSLLFNLLSNLVIAFLKASFNFIAAITICSDFGAQENKVFNCFHYFPICLHEVMGLNAMILVF